MGMGEKGRVKDERNKKRPIINLNSANFSNRSMNFRV